jgi:hypothetical protein
MGPRNFGTIFCRSQFLVWGSGNTKIYEGEIIMDDCLIEKKRIQYEDLYREAWEAQCKRDAEIDPRIDLKSTRKEDGRVSRWHKRV